MIITIPSWEKYNPRVDSKRPNWFRFQNDFFFRQSIHSLDAEDKLLFIALMCMASKNNGGTYEALPTYLSQLLGTSTIKILTSIKKLVKNQLITTNSRGARTDLHEVVRDTHPTVQYRQDKTDNTEDGCCDLFKIWEEHRGKLPRCIKNTDKRRARAIKLVNGETTDTAYWISVIKRMNDSKFCRGEVDPPEGRKRFRADYDFFIQQDVHVKVMEGKYDDDKGLTPKVRIINHDD